MRRIAPLLLLCFGVLLAGFFVYTYERNIPPAEVRYREIPLVTFANLDGKETDLGAFKGKPLLINMWATWCPYCREEIPIFFKLQKEREDIGVIFVNRGERVETVKFFLSGFSDFSTTTIVLIDSEDVFYSQINGFSMPETLFVDKDGLIQYHQRGPMTLEEMRRRVQSVFP